VDFEGFFVLKEKSTELLRRIEGHWTGKKVRRYQLTLLAEKGSFWMVLFFGWTVDWIACFDKTLQIHRTLDSFESEKRIHHTFQRVVSLIIYKILYSL